MTADPTASALASFSLVATMCGAPVDGEDVLHRYGQLGRFDAPEILRAAKGLGLRARSVSPSLARLIALPLPALARGRDGTYFVVAKIGPDAAGVAEKVLIFRPLQGGSLALTVAEFAAQWDGTLILIGRKMAIGDPNRPFGISWFFNAIFRYQRILGEVLLVSFALQLLGLATPLFFQVIVDKVLVHNGMSTLNVVAIGLGLALTFEVVLGGLRSYVFSHTTNRIDVELSANLFRHLLQLPLAYFTARRVGDGVARVRELETIRQFLTGSTLTLVLDIIFGSVFLAVIFLYSPTLGWIVAAGAPLYFAISFLATPALRLGVQEKFRRGSENQSFLVETISGIETLKSMAVEPQTQLRWEEQLSRYVSAAFRVTRIGVVAGQSAQLVSRITTLALLYFGARLVMQEKLTIGQLIAVNMLAGQLSGPILRIAQLWQDFQQVRVSVDRVGDILNTPPEPNRAPGATASGIANGSITFDAVEFRYQLEGARALNGLSLEVPAGQVLGIVGPSGSGKSTMAKLLQRLRSPESGRVMIDGLDLTMMDASALRRQVGVVMQESLLFNGSIRDNIALSNPAMTMDRVAAAARLAGAHDFIAELAAGYDAEVGERGVNLSGGQRQRIAIARVLATNPKVLIFDEATSALDLESEMAIQANMRSICAGRTVLIIAHRLSALRGVDRIVTVERGRVVEDGSHLDLVQAGGRYARLWAAQTERR